MTREIRLADSLRGWAGASHPFPLVMVVALTALIGLASTQASPPAARFAALLLAMTCSQFAIGWSNDYVDRRVDAVYQPDKPVPSGLVRAQQMPYAIALVLLASLVLGVYLGAVPLLLLATGTAAGLVYNLGVKATRFSAAPFIVAFAVLPPYVWTALDAWRAEFLTLYVVGLTLPAAAHLANVLPDIDTDRAQGRRTVAVVLGRGRSLAVLAACLVAAPVALAIVSRVVDDVPAGREPLGFELAFGVVAIYAALCALLPACYAAKSGREGDVWGFRVVVLASVLFAAGWLASV